ncbi:MAG: hypothetical protein JSW35_09110 [Deltaproteobacteria bacterium]|nr:MAG: hypothetical protein JSW35_09110 [Deltaproteobacteria bacterium]
MCETNYIVPRLTDETEEGMGALFALFLGVVANTSPLVISLDRGDVGIQVEGDRLPSPEIVSELHEEVKVERCDPSRDGNPQRAGKTADGRLHQEGEESRYLLKYLVSRKDLHVPWP